MRLYTLWHSGHIKVEQETLCVQCHMLGLRSRVNARVRERVRVRVGVRVSNS